MIPKRMYEFLRDVLPERTWQRRRQVDGPRVYMEFGPLDVDRLQRLGITVDNLGPRLVVAMWDEASPLEIGGYLVVDNLAMGRPSMGGIRMLPDITPAIIHNLARGMTLKNAAANLPYGGGKAGMVAPADQSPEEHEAIVHGFAHLLQRYTDIYNPGPDVGTNDADMKTIAIENGLDNALSKPADMGGNRIDELGGAAGGVVIAIDTLLEQLERLRILPQFKNLEIPVPDDVTVLIQGFGAVGAHVARVLWERSSGPRVIGISDAHGYLYAREGLPIGELLQMRDEHKIATFPYFLSRLVDERGPEPRIKFSNACNDLLRESAFCFVPAAPVANYLDVDESSHPSMTVDRMGKWGMIVEGANTYSPDPARKAARARMERVVYRQAGVMIATDYLVNSGGVIFAAYERLIPTPPELQIPSDRLGNREAVEAWLVEHRPEFAALAEQRRIAAEAQRNEVIRHNMVELVDLLISDVDMLPCEAAEQISINRIASSERFRTVADVMEALPTVPETCTVRDAARTLVGAGSDILAVVSETGRLVGVVTEWDVTRASAGGCAEDVPLSEIMTRDVITCCAEDSILDVVRKLELYEISAMPVMEGERVIGVISGDLLARRTLYRLLQAQGS
ncbi:MAG TPA: CBS domain-containing protein [Anaerolineae bacterium]|nr:CBS domain-containing protein [Anaerolineae bacterium]